MEGIIDIGPDLRIRKQLYLLRRSLRFGRDHSW